MSAVLSLPKVLGAAQASAWFASWSPVAAARELRLVLPAGATLRPTGIVLLAAGIAERQRLGLATRLEHEPGADEARRSLERIGFSAALGLGADGGFACREDSGRFVPLRRITDKRIARELAEASADGLEAELPRLSSSPLRMARFV